MTTIVVFLLVALALIGFLFLSPPPEVIEGQAEATSVRVSGKLPGRVVEFYVAEGDTVQEGDTLVHIHSSLVEAKLMQAEAMEDAAAAANQKVDAGTRSQSSNRPTTCGSKQSPPKTSPRRPTTAWRTSIKRT